MMTYQSANRIMETSNRLANALRKLVQLEAEPMPEQVNYMDRLDGPGGAYSKITRQWESTAEALEKLAARIDSKGAIA